MYRERKFDSWMTGLIHLIVEIALPIIPVIVYMVTDGNSNGYLYVLLLTVVTSFLYESLSGYNNNCSTWIMVETIVCSVTLAFMLIATIFLLVLSHSNGGDSQGLGCFDYILVSLFVVPICITVIEIVRCIGYDANDRKMLSKNKNLVKGASEV